MLKFLKWLEIFIHKYESGKFTSMNKNEKCVIHFLSLGI